MRAALEFAHRGRVHQTGISAHSRAAHAARASFPEPAPVAPDRSAPSLPYQVIFEIFWPRNRRRTITALRADRGQGFTPEQIETLITGVADHVARQFPAHDYSLVSIGPAFFQFVWLGEKA